MVDLLVLPERLDDFLDAITRNAAASVRDEPGCLRFDVHRSLEDPCRFLLHEVYRDRPAFERDHRAAPHYAEWLEAAQRCLARARQTTLFETVALTGGDAAPERSPA
ncbi:putative quinol monooxygenase [Intrasporangium flavum]|uniref:putative quinol monooxygenase n=1 Tax=Intrasporangium flavum TaxID=1428657 RepID=UPI001A966B56|nr:putative quinol monooxygenase [Intrasporangium flavum]